MALDEFFFSHSKLFKSLFKDFDPVKMATNLFGTVKTSLANISFPWSANN